MVVGAAIDDNGRPICPEMWPGNTADVTALVPVAERLQKRFAISSFCVVGDRGMVSNDTLEKLEQLKLSYILGARMRRVKDIKEQVLAGAGAFARSARRAATKKTGAAESQRSYS